MAPHAIAGRHPTCGVNEHASDLAPICEEPYPKLTVPRIHSVNQLF